MYLLEGTGSGSLEDTWDSESGEGESLEWVEDAGECGGGAIDQDSGSIGNVNNNNNFAEVFSEVYVSNSAWLDEVLEHLRETINNESDHIPFLLYNFILNNKQ